MAEGKGETSQKNYWARKETWCQTGTGIGDRAYEGGFTSNETHGREWGYGHEDKNGWDSRRTKRERRRVGWPRSTKSSSCCQGAEKQWWVAGSSQGAN